MSDSRPHSPPVLVFVELTRKCDLACIHCRASAGLDNNAGQMDRKRIIGFLEELLNARKQKFHVIYTGGNVALYPDLPKLMQETRELGLSFSLSPSPSAAASSQFITDAWKYGSTSISTSMDGLQNTHDRIRGDKSSFFHATRIISQSSRAGMPVQVNTLVAQETLADLPFVFRKIKSLNVPVWELFFLINTGRGIGMTDLRPDQMEDVLHWLVHIRKSIKFIRTVEAPFYSRVLSTPCSMIRTGPLFSYLTGITNRRISPEDHERGGIRSRGRTLFVSSEGEIYPSGFLPITLGNIDEAPFSKEFQEYISHGFSISPEKLEGACGSCPYSVPCGGSRSRAYAYTGNPLESDPACIMTGLAGGFTNGFHLGRGAENDGYKMRA
ncbi:MAG: radical SAM protein [Thermoplasmataceae archaeon]